MKTRVFTVQEKDGQMLRTKSFGLMWLEWFMFPEVGMIFAFDGKKIYRHDPPPEIPKYLIHKIQLIPESDGDIEIFVIPQ